MSFHALSQSASGDFGQFPGRAIHSTLRHRKTIHHWLAPCRSSFVAGWRHVGRHLSLVGATVGRHLSLVGATVVRHLSLVCQCAPLGAVCAMLPLFRPQGS